MSKYTSNLHKVFVYGTLKKREPNHYWFKRSNQSYYKFKCKAETIEKFPLIIATKYNIPFMLYHPGFGKKVQGEVYEVNDSTLLDLDDLENHPNFYERLEFLVRPTGTRGVKLRTWVYLILQFRPELLNKPLYQDYTSNGEHGLRYATRFESLEQYDYRSEILR